MVSTGGNVPDLSNFTFASAQIHLTLERPLEIAGWIGSAFRGGLGLMLKKAVCVAPREDCARCVLHHSCTYAAVFDSRRDATDPLYASLKEIPRPFVLEFSRDGLHSAKAVQQTFRLVLIGRAIHSFAYLVYALMQLGEAGLGKQRIQYTIDRIIQDTPGFQARSLYDAQSQRQIRDPEFTRGSQFAPASPTGVIPKVRLNFLSPLRVKSGGQMSEHVAFRTLVGSALRRLAQLQYFHCGTPLLLDFPAYLQEAESVPTENQQVRWVEWERFSSRQKTEMTIGGITGTITYSRVPAKYLPVLRLAVHTHIGKLSTFGFGQYTLGVEGES
ncbi:MAG: CRISPR system precrRNA processing endoribonuclease RAMP protein Cas6 [Candidatus Sumerlaeia bacterium]|nr:CRISPR system precrRNA processing endoribonuclease RAMP protein Cas6 [Candidatus Sumerlaeia bacterium]